MMTRLNKKKDLKNDLLSFIKKRGGASLRSLYENFSKFSKQLIRSVLKDLENKNLISHRIMGKKSFFQKV